MTVSKFLQYRFGGIIPYKNSSLHCNRASDSSWLRYMAHTLGLVTFDLGASLYLGDLVLDRAIGPSPWFSFLALAFVRSPKTFSRPPCVNYTSFMAELRELEFREKIYEFRSKGSTLLTPWRSIPAQNVDSNHSTSNLVPSPMGIFKDNLFFF